MLLFMSNLLLQDIKKYKLGDPSSFHYLNQSSCIRVDGINDAEEYLATRNAMDMVGITEQEQVFNPALFSRDLLSCRYHIFLRM
jgi:myosin heavy subunit